MHTSAGCPRGTNLTQEHKVLVMICKLMNQLKEAFIFWQCFNFLCLKLAVTVAVTLWGSVNFTAKISLSTAGCYHRESNLLEKE